MKKAKIYYRYPKYAFASDYVGRIVGKKVEIIKNRDLIANFDTITKEEFLKYKTKYHSIIQEEDIICIMPKKLALLLSLERLQGK